MFQNLLKAPHTAGDKLVDILLTSFLRGPSCKLPNTLNSVSLLLQVDTSGGGSSVGESAMINAEQIEITLTASGTAEQVLF